MDRKKTILIAVMINAGLLVVLFIGALTRQDDVLLQESAEPLAKLQSPLFSDEADFALQKGAPLQIPLDVEAVRAEPVLAGVPKNEETTLPLHKLPSVASAQIAAEPVVPIPASPVAIHTPAKDALQEVVVKKGDSLDKIAKAHHTSIDEIIKLNQLPGSFLKVGQILQIPSKKSEVASRPSTEKEKSPIGTAVEYYTVKVGDNPWSIAMKHHMKVEELLKLNGLNEENARKLKPGNRLRIR